MSQLALPAVRWDVIPERYAREAARDLTVLLGAANAGMVTEVRFTAPASVFGVTGSPLTGAGTIALSFASQAAGLVLASPAGAPGEPAFRALTASEVGALSSVATQVKNTFPAGPTTGADAAPTWRVLDKADLPAEAARTDQANGLTGNQTVTAGDFIANTAGKGLKVKEGANARMGTAVLAAGTIAVPNTSVTANTRIFVAVSTPGGTQGHLSVSKSAGVGFTVTSTDATETSTVEWLLVEPA